MNFLKSLNANVYCRVGQLDFHCYVCGGKEYFVEQVIWGVF